MKTIGVDIRVLGTGRISGVEEYTEQVLAHMTALNSDVRWKLFYSGRTPLTRREWMDRQSVTVYETHRSNRALWLTTRLMGRPCLDVLVGGADVFFFPHFLLGSLARGCRRVMTWHDLSYERMPHLLSVHRRFWHAVQMQPRVQAQAADRIIAVSRATASDLGSLYGIPDERIAVVYSGVDPVIRRASEPAVLRWRESRGVTHPFVLALGTREPRKNLPALIRAWDIARRASAFRDVHLVIAGEPGWGERMLHDAIEATRFPRDVHMLDGIGRHERPLILSAASALVYPSFMEGFGFPPLEAMACGTPVIASATSSLVETVGNAGVLVDPYRIDGIAGALVAVVSDAGLRSRLVSRGYDHVRRFSWERAAEQTLGEIVAVL